jgi:hypothetical protein
LPLQRLQNRVKQASDFQFSLQQRPDKLRIFRGRFQAVGREENGGRGTDFQVGRGYQAGLLHQRRAERETAFFDRGG